MAKFLSRCAFKNILSYFAKHLHTIKAKDKFKKISLFWCVCTFGKKNIYLVFWVTYYTFSYLSLYAATFKGWEILTKGLD
jgi:hypothetical protein